MANYRKRDYDAFAAVIKRAKIEAMAEGGLIAALGAATVQKELMKFFKDDNPAFKELQFIEACGTGEKDAPAPTS